ncbi:MAG: hypothetical protein ABIV43_00805 [Candidatus Saccharimonadales bacterium]
MKNINIYQKSITAFFLAVVAYWAYLVFDHHNSTNLSYWYSLIFGFVPLFGGFIGMEKAFMWGGFKSAVGKAIFFFSFGLTLWGIGETIWSYYNFVEGVAAPYPSIADLGFAPSIFFWILGIAYFSQATGAIFALGKSQKAKFFAIAAPILLLIPSYILQVNIARGGQLIPGSEGIVKSMLDIAYPFGDFLALTFAAVIFILSHKYLGGIYRRAIIFMLSGLAVMYAGDTIFSYTTTKGTYYNASWGDLILAFGLFLMTYGILAFASKPVATYKTRNSENQSTEIA